MLICRYNSFNTNVNEKRSDSERRKHCTLAVVRRSQKISPHRRPLPGAQDGQNLISWSLEMVTTFTYKPSLVRHAISSYRGNRPTHTHKQTHTQTEPITNTLRR